VNAAFLLVTTAWLAGADAAPQAAPAPAPAAATTSTPVVSGTVSGDCGCGCDSCQEGLFSRLRHRLFHRQSECGCDSCGHVNYSCECDGGHRWGHRLRSWWHRRNCCECDCGSSCGSGGCGSGSVMPRAGEAIPAPQEPPAKKMPSGKTPPPAKNSTSIEPPMTNGATVSTPAPAPELNTAPAIPDVPAAPERKDPF
jgi:hypothetical protein